MDTNIRYNDDCTRDNYMIIVRDSLSVDDKDHNLIPLFAMRKIEINLRTVSNF